MKRIEEVSVRVGDILWTGGSQYFYVHNICNGRMVMSGIEDDGDIFDKDEIYSASYVMTTDEERSKFFNLIEKFNLKFNKNRGVYCL